MTNVEFVNKLKEIVKLKTLYVNGAFGAPACYGSNKDKYISNYSFNRTSDRAKLIRAASADTFFFDCICLGKSVLWGFSGDVNRIYGGAAYCSNGVPDFGTESAMGLCEAVSADFTKDLVIGEWLWKSGHVGYYAGDGKVIECTISSKADGVQLRDLSETSWVKHGKIKFLEYIVEEKPKEELSIECPCCHSKFILDRFMSVK